LKFDTDEKGRHIVTVHQVARDLDGDVILDKTVEQIFTIEDNLIKTFEIAEADEPKR